MSKRSIHSQWIVAVASTIGLVSQAIATPTLIPKPDPVHAFAEAGRDVAQLGNYSLLGAYRIGPSFYEESGGAYLFENRNPNYVQKFQLPTSVNITKDNGDSCTILNTQNSLVGERVAMSENWIALDANQLGGGDGSSGGPAFWGDCGHHVPTIFLAKRTSASGSQPFTDLVYSIPVPEGVPQYNTRVYSLDMTDTTLVIGTYYGAHIFSFNGSDWVFSQTLTGDNLSGESFGSPVAIDGNRIVIGDPGGDSGGRLYYYEKNGSTWSLQDVHTAQFGANWEFGKAVDIDGDRIVAAAKHEYFNFSTQESEVMAYVEFLRINNGQLVSIGRDYDFASHTVAVSGDKVIAGGYAIQGVTGVPQSEPTNLYSVTNSSWTFEGHITGVNDLHNRENAIFFTDQVDIDGDIVIAGWRGYETENGESAVGALVIDSFGPFSNLPLLDNAEGTQLWKNAGEFDWTRHSGSTPSWNTGPSSGANGSANYYYVETSAGSAYGYGDTAILESGYFDPENTELHFNYHMLGSDMGTLYIDVQIFGNWYTNFWSRHGQYTPNISPNWQTGYFDTSGFYGLGDIKLRFRYVANGGYRGDVALDNIYLTPQ